jgi:putative hydrolase of the HAD superfamily
MLAKSLPELRISKTAVDAIAYDKVFNDDVFAFYDDVKPALELLKPQMKLGIISDTWPSAKRILQNAGLWKYFDAITFSCHLGVFKPDSKMYKHAIGQMDLLPNEICFVDDSMTNLDGAAQYGITPIMISRNNYPRVAQQNKYFPKAVEQSKYRKITGLLELTRMFDIKAGAILKKWTA